MEKPKNNVWLWWLVGGGAVALSATAAITNPTSRKLIKRTIKTVADIILKPEQLAMIKTLNPSVQATAIAFINRIETETGYSVIITSANRTFAKQAALKKENPKNAAAGASKHNFGVAWDINLYQGKTFVRKADSKEKWLNTGVPQIAASMGLKWGGMAFEGYYDPVHFEVPIPLSKLVALKQQQKVEGNLIKLPQDILNQYKLA